MPLLFSCGPSKMTINLNIAKMEDSPYNYDLFMSEKKQLLSSQLLFFQYKKLTQHNLLDQYCSPWYLTISPISTGVSSVSLMVNCPTSNQMIWRYVYWLTDSLLFMYC